MDKNSFTAAQRSRLCNGTSPLINPATGEEFHCGDGGTICPPGTYCHRAHGFAKCCRDHSVRIAGKLSIFYIWRSSSQSEITSIQIIVTSFFLAGICTL